MIDYPRSSESLNELLRIKKQRGQEAGSGSKLKVSLWRSISSLKFHLLKFASALKWWPNVQIQKPMEGICLLRHNDLTNKTKKNPRSSSKYREGSLTHHKYVSFPRKRLSKSILSFFDNCHMKTKHSKTFIAKSLSIPYRPCPSI